jgi:hypothetical protein
MTRMPIAVAVFAIATLAHAQEHMTVVKSIYDEDKNKLPLNPQWKCQRDANCPGNPQRPDADDLCDHEPVPPKCTTHFTLDQPTGFKQFICGFETDSKIHGHMNFTPATFYGAVAWEERTIDADFNFALTPVRGHGTTANASTIHSEFDSRESLFMFRKAFGWWGDLYAAVPDNKKVKAMIDSTAANAVVTGLFGLDCEHDCKPELHPIYLMGLRTPGKLDKPERWAVFARNAGNEGYCASKKHSLGREELHLLLPNRVAKLIAGTAKFYGTRTNMKAPVITPVTGVGLLITFRVASGDVIVGELEQERSPSGGMATFSMPKFSAKQRRLEEAAEEREEKDSAEQIIARLLESRPKVEQKNFESYTMPSMDAMEDEAAAQFELQPEIRPAITAAEYRAEIAAAQAPEVTHTDDPEQAQNDERIRRALCAAYNNQLPDARLKDACKP